jgi:hypothetical protein
VKGHPCVECAKENCCDLVVMCLFDNTCLNLAQCIDGGGTFDECEMIHGQSQVSMDMRTCAQSMCVECN